MRQRPIPGLSLRRTPADVRSEREQLAAIQTSEGLDSVVEARLLRDLRELGAPEPIPGFAFDRTRQFRADFGWPEHRVLVEVEGGIWSGGRHVRGQGYRQDCEKYRRAAIAGWCLLRYVTEDVVSRAAAREIAMVLAARSTAAADPKA
jgi:very-short-patch-repair endonuclease